MNYLKQTIDVLRGLEEVRCLVERQRIQLRHDLSLLSNHDTEEIHATVERLYLLYEAAEPLQRAERTGVKLLKLLEEQERNTRKSG